MHFGKDSTDSELLTSLTAGSEAAFNSIYDRFWKRLYNEAYKRLGDQSLSEEVVQDIFIDLWNSRFSRKIDCLNAYLVGAVRNQVFSLYHKKSRLPTFEEPLDFIAFSTDDADAGYLHNELIVRINSWLNTLPEKRREIFRLRYLEEMSTLEIADHLKISRKTVQNQLNHSQLSLRNSIAKFILLFILLLHL